MADTPVNPGVGTLALQGFAPLVVQSYSASGVAPLVNTLVNLFPAQTVPMVDIQSGRAINEWYRYLRSQLVASTTGVNALDPDAVRQAIEDSRSNVLRLQNLTVAITAMIDQNAASQVATLATVQAIAAAAAPGLVTQAGAIPPVQPYLPDSTGGGD